MSTSLFIFCTQKIAFKTYSELCYATLQIGGLKLNETNTCGMLIRQINNALAKRVNNQLKAKDITLSQMSALIEILNTPGKKLTFKELEKCF